MKKTYYQGNPNLKKAGISIDWTPETIIEYKRCMNNIEYFAEKYFKIVSLDHGLINIPLYDYQREILQAYRDERFVCGLQSRQSGKCVVYNTAINIRNKKSNEVKTISIGELYEEVKSKKVTEEN